MFVGPCGQASLTAEEREQVALFERSRGVIHVQADGESSFVLGSARQDSDAVGRPVIDEAVEAFVFGEMKGAVEPPVARSGRRCGLIR